MHWILGIALTAAVFMLLKQWGGLTPEKKKAATWKLVLMLGGALLLFMVLTGRVHILTAALAALVPLLRKLPALLKVAPLLNRMYTRRKQRPEGGDGDRGGRQTGDERQRVAEPGRMSVREACDILGVPAGCSENEVIMAHRRLMQKIHPDRGGNDYLAAQVNEAKATLLAACRGAA